MKVRGVLLKHGEVMTCFGVLLLVFGGSFVRGGRKGAARWLRAVPETQFESANCTWKPP